MNIKYTTEQLDELVKVLNNINVMGFENVRALALAFQIIQAGELIVEEVGEVIGTD